MLKDNKGYSNLQHQYQEMDMPWACGYTNDTVMPFVSIFDCPKDCHNFHLEEPAIEIRNDGTLRLNESDGPWNEVQSTSHIY